METNLQLNSNSNSYTPEVTKFHVLWPHSPLSNVEPSDILAAKATFPGSSNTNYNRSKETVMIKIAEEFNCFILIVPSTKETPSRCDKFIRILENLRKILDDIGQQREQYIKILEQQSPS